MTTDLTQDMHRKHLLSFGNNYQNLETKPTLALDFRIVLITACDKLKTKPFLKAELPINLKEEKEENIEPQIQFYISVFRIAETDRYHYFIRIRKHKTIRNSQYCWTFRSQHKSENS
jgi:RNA polymerase sigma-70 factor (ECF subfamily)